MKGIRIIPEDINVNFVGMRYLAFALSVIVVLASLGALFTKGLNFGLDFTGGTAIEIHTQEAPDLAALRTLLDGLNLGAVSIQEFGEPTDTLIRLPQQEGGAEVQKQAIETVRAALEEYFDGNVELRRVEFVGPQVGEELKKAGALAVLFSLGSILAYIWFRYEWQFGLAAVLALAHDSIAIPGLFSIRGMQFDLSTVAAILMIAGYSINDTVIVFDRIRENLRKYKKMPLPELFNMSINQTLSRTIMTSGTTLLVLFSLWLFGGEVIRGFVDALLFGILIGTYSSIFVAAPLLIYIKIRRQPETEGEPAAAS